MNDLPNAIDRLVGARVRRRREALGFCLVKFAAAIGIAADDIEAHESGRIRVPARLLEKMAQVLDVPILYFFEMSPAGAAGPHYGEHLARPSSRRLPRKPDHEMIGADR